MSNYTSLDGILAYALLKNSPSGNSEQHAHSSKDITSMTGYEKVSDSSDISTSDSLNTAIGKLEYGKVDKYSDSVVIGNGSTASGVRSTAMGYGNTASGNNSSTLGARNTTNYKQSSAIGYNNTADADYSTAIGTLNTTSGAYSSTFGYGNTASGSNSSAIGYRNNSNGNSTLTLGVKNTANGEYSKAIGYETTANYKYETVFGLYNKVVEDVSSLTKDLLTVGNGTSSIPSNAFRITYTGDIYANGSYNSSGADFAEYFEWEDGNPNNEDRIGYFVTLENDKIRIANESDDYILGVISGTASIIGNSCSEDWGSKYIKDEWGRVQFEEVTIPTEYETVVNEETGEEEKVLVSEEHTITTMKTNSSYSSEEKYIPRSERKEWDVVGLLGQMYVRDDGSCEVGGYCKCGSGGVATKSDTKENSYRVLARTGENIIKVLFR